MKPTPRPWKIGKPEHPGPDQENDRLIYVTDRKTGKKIHIAETFQYQNHVHQDGPSIANAHLIAKCVNLFPDMLEALEHLVACEALHLSVENNIREIIRKAKGD